MNKVLPNYGVISCIFLIRGILSLYLCVSQLSSSFFMAGKCLLGSNSNYDWQTQSKGWSYIQEDT